VYIWVVAIVDENGSPANKNNNLVVRAIPSTATAGSVFSGSSSSHPKAKLVII